MCTCNRPATPAIHCRAVVAAAARAAPTCGAEPAQSRAGKTVAVHNPLYLYTDIVVGTVAAARSYRIVVVVAGVDVGVVGIRAECAALSRSWRDRAGTHCAVS